MKPHFRKILTVVLCLSLILVSLVTVAAENQDTGNTTTAMRMQPLLERYKALTQTDLDLEMERFNDVLKHWGKNYITKISALGIISGYGSKFGPDDKLLAGQYILMLVRTMGFTPEVPSGTPYYMPFVDIALKEGILKKDEVRDYMKPISRELAASLARRVIGSYEEVPHDYFVPGDDFEGKGDKGFFDNVYVGYQKTKMTDWTTIDTRYLQDVIDCYRMGVMAGNNNKFNPKSTLTRAEASVIIVKLIDKSARVESIPGPNESFKFTNPKSMDEFNCTEEYGRYENKEYTMYKGMFPLMEIWDTAYAMNKNYKLIKGGAFTDGYHEKTMTFGIGWFPDSEVERKYRLDNYYGIIVPNNNIDVHTDKVRIAKGERYSLWDNATGELYSVSSSVVDDYNKALKDYVYELMKLWFGKEYTKAKQLHDQYLELALKDVQGKSNFYLINGRQVFFSGGRDSGGNGFSMEVWAKGFINEKTLYKR